MRHDIRRHSYPFARDTVLDDSFDFVLYKFRDDDFLGMGYAVEFECLGNTPRGANMDSRNSYRNSYLESSKFLPLPPGDGRSFGLGALHDRVDGDDDQDHHRDMAVPDSHDYNLGPHTVYNHRDDRCRDVFDVDGREGGRRHEDGDNYSPGG